MNLRRRLHYGYVRAVAKALWMNESVFFYPALRQFYREAFHAKNPDTILDVGANRGQSILIFRKLFPRVTIHAFEPNPRLFGILTRHFTVPGIHLHPLGVSNQTGQLEFHEHLLDETSGFEPAKTDSKYLRRKNKVLLTSSSSAIFRKYDVPVTTLDAFMAASGPVAIDILKIDVEGHELAVLEGAAGLLASGRIQYLQLEAHADDQVAGRQQAILQLLHAAGYSECFRKRHGFGHFYEVIYKRSPEANHAYRQTGSKF